MRGGAGLFPSAAKKPIRQMLLKRQERRVEPRWALGSALPTGSAGDHRKDLAKDDHTRVE